MMDGDEYDGLGWVGGVLYLFRVPYEYEWAQYARVFSLTWAAHQTNNLHFNQLVC